MNENTKKIIELSDCEWIRKREIWKENSYYYNIRTNEISTIRGELYWQQEKIKGDVCLPVGFNPESGRLQIADLITELNQIRPSKMNNYWDIHDRLIEIWGLIVR